MANIQQYRKQYDEVREIRHVRLNKSEQDFLTNFAKKNGLVWGDKPNLSAAIRKLIEREESQELLVFLVAKSLAVLYDNRFDDGTQFQALDMIGEICGPEAFNEVVKSIEAGTLKPADYNANSQAAGGSGETDFEASMSWDERYDKRYREWYSALAGYPEATRRQLSQANAKHDADIGA